MCGIFSKEVLSKHVDVEGNDSN
ncbi:DUF2627 domain-containing protein, partial [Escherichia coli]